MARSSYLRQYGYVRPRRRCAIVGRTGLWVWPLAVLLFWWCCGGSQVSLAAAGHGLRLEVVGAVQDSTGRGIANVQVKVELPGQPLAAAGEAPLVTDKQGRFQGTFFLPVGVAPPSEVVLRAGKPSWQPQAVRITVRPAQQQAKAGGVYQAMGVLTLSRQVTPALWLATGILLAVYLLIALEWLHRALAALGGAALMLFLSYTIGQYSSDFFIISFDEAIAAIDLNVILLLLGMMLIVGITKKTGLFQWLAYKAFAWARGRVMILVLILMWLTAGVSAWLDNVTTMLLLVPVSLELARTLQLKPVALLLPEVFASNVGGTATLIGDPPNIIIGSYANLTFGDFGVHLTPVVILCMVAASGFFLFYYRRDYARASGTDVAAIPIDLQQRYRIRDRRLLGLCLFLLGMTILLFLCQGLLGMAPSIAALMGSAVLVTVARVNITTLLAEEIEWPTLIFFMGLFMVIAGAEETGLIQLIAQEVRELSRGNLVLATLLILWVSALLSAIIDNIPFTVTMLPIITYLNNTLPGAESGVLWWALALGACLGGNGTLIGASANVVTVGLAVRAGCPITFLDYLRACFLPMLITIGICSLYLLWLR
ncbi:MAG: SLC13 family permease [Desulfobacca sp.]|uniref:SLC13 family permease n=1 Tax=Desulfobacca sp. TaxID=2067990 RepID=UPI00404B4D0D